MPNPKKQVRHTREQRLLLWDRAIALLMAGYRLDHVSTELGVHRNTISQWRRNPEFKLKLARSQKRILSKHQEATALAVDAQILTIEQQIQSAGEKALVTMTEKLNSENELVQVKAASDLMDRDNRMSRTRKIETKGVHAIVTAEQLVLAARAARELRENTAFLLPPAPVDTDAVIVGQIEAERV